MESYFRSPSGGAKKIIQRKYDFVAQFFFAPKEWDGNTILCYWILKWNRNFVKHLHVTLTQTTPASTTPLHHHASVRGECVDVHDLFEKENYRQCDDIELIEKGKRCLGVEVG